MKKIRLDQFLSESGLSSSREKARREIISGWVQVDKETVREPSKKICGDESITIERPGGYFVSRGGEKLLHALGFFSLDVTGKVIVDFGASTGGFTDCMIKSGAKKVYAVDVGNNQLDYSLRIDKRVICMEKMHVKDVKKEMFSERIDFFTADLSFISILKALPSIYSLFNTISGVVLIKPQFEAYPAQQKKGVVKNPDFHVEILQRVAAGVQDTGFIINDVIYSPIKGAAGNIEFFFSLEKNSASRIDTCNSINIDHKITSVVEIAHKMLKDR